MNVLIISDIHGNQQAFEATLKKAQQCCRIDACIFLGDMIDYGMHSNEVIHIARCLELPILCNLRGNHEDAIINEDYSRFSTDRGRKSAQYTRSILSKGAWEYIINEMHGSGMSRFEMDGKKCLAVHGCLTDEYWASITADVDPNDYSEYDYVFSGHSHCPHFFEKYVASGNIKTRNQKKIVFINPGSVGQPRNINAMAQYVLLDTVTEEVIMGKVSYDISREQKSYDGQIDDFYKERMRIGI